MDMGADPTGEILCGKSFGVGVVACSQNGYEKISRQHFPSISIDDVHGVTGKVHEHLLSGPVTVSENGIQFLEILSVLLRKIAGLKGESQWPEGGFRIF